MFSFIFFTKIRSVVNLFFKSRPYKPLAAPAVCLAMFLLGFPSDVAAQKLDDVARKPAGSAANTTELFNGKNLTGWRPMSLKGFPVNDNGWTVGNRSLYCSTSNSGWLMFNRKYGDFVLELEFKLTRGGNSGVLIRHPGAGASCDEAMEIQLIDESAYGGDRLRPEQRTGAIYGVVGPSFSALNPVGQWNTLRVACEGNNIIVSINGRKAAAVEMSQHGKLRRLAREGYIGLYNWKGQAKGTAFRNIRVCDLQTPFAQLSEAPHQNRPMDDPDPQEKQEEGRAFPLEYSKEDSGAPGDEMVRKAVRLFNGVEGEVNEMRAKELLAKAHAAGDPLATMWIARFTEDGVCGFEKDPKRGQQLARSVLDRVATLGRGGNLDAQYLTLIAGLSGLAPGPQPDPRETTQQMRKVAEQGHAPAEEFMALSNELGTVLDPDTRKTADYAREAIHWYRKAAEHGSARCQYHLGVIYRDGRARGDRNIVAPDAKQAANWFRQAVQRGHVKAQFNLALLYGKGDGVDQDREQMVYWFRKAAERGLSHAQYNMGVIYGEGKVVERDYKQAVRWYRLAAEQGDELAQYNLSLHYQYGLGVEPSEKEAMAWCLKSAKAGFAWAQYNLGVSFVTGYGVRESFSKAAAWFKKAADQENPWAQNNLGVFYENGWGGLRRNLGTARKLYAASARQGIQTASQNLARLSADRSSGRLSFGSHGPQEYRQQVDNQWKKQAEQMERQLRYGMEQVHWSATHSAPPGRTGVIHHPGILQGPLGR